MNRSSVFASQASSPDIGTQLRDLKTAVNVLLRRADGRHRDTGDDQLRLVSQAALLVRSITNPATTTQPGWASELVGRDLLALLLAANPPSLLPQLAAFGLSLTSHGSAGSDAVPIPVPSADPLAQWVSEGMPAPGARLAFASVALNTRKVSALSVYTGELSKRSSVDVQAVLSGLLANDCRRLIDRSLTDAEPASSDRPAGLLNGVTALPASASTDPAIAMVADIKALLGALLAGGASYPVLIASTLAAVSFATLPSELAVPLLLSPEVPPDRLIAVDGASFVSLLAAPEMSLSTEAVVHESDEPLPISSGTPLRSLWQTDSRGILIRVDCGWATPVGRVAFIDGIGW